jgi:4-hydroxy-3-methylbut-2-enyl diphosphate reductase
MKIILAKTSGFCMGVRRAVETALDAPHQHHQPIHTFGPLIHNPQVLNLLTERGIKTLETVPEKGIGTVLIRAHGVPPSTKQALGQAGFTVIDATCPRVIKVQTIISKHGHQGFASIILGDREHPEVIGLLGYANGNGHVASTLEDLEALPPFEKAIIVAQTTQNKAFYEEVKKWAQTHHPHYKVFDTICGSTENRQAEIRQLSREVEALVVVGGKDSGNTRRLATIAEESGKPVFHVESEEELDTETLSKFRIIGLTAGASTPNWIIKRVRHAIEDLPLTRTNKLRSFFYRLQKALLLTNLYGAFGAGCLCYVASTLQGIHHRFSVSLIAMFYVLTMHLVNNLTGNKANQYNDPERAEFFRDHQWAVLLLCLISSVACLLIAFSLGLLPFAIILIMSLTGLSYNLKLAPRNWRFGKARGIRDIPGSKTFFVAAAWGVIAAVFPVIAKKETPLSFITFIAFSWTTILVFVRTAFYNVLDMQGDRIVGKETLPILVGEEKTLLILRVALVGAGLLVLSASLAGHLSDLGYYLLVCPALMLGLLEMQRRDIPVPGLRWEFLVESVFVVAGLITFLWVVL